MYGNPARRREMLELERLELELRQMKAEIAATEAEVVDLEFRSGFGQPDRSRPVFAAPAGQSEPPVHAGERRRRRVYPEAAGVGALKEMVAGSLDSDHGRRVATHEARGGIAEHRPRPVAPLMLEIDRGAEGRAGEKIE